MNMGVLLIFAVVLMLRMQNQERTVGAGLMLIEVLALAGAAVGAWYLNEIATNRRAPAFARVQSGHRSY